MQNYYFNRTQFPENQIKKSSSNSDNEMMARDDIIGELQAINQYQKHYEDTNNPVVKQTLKSIRIEEEIHFGELVALLFYLNPESKVQFEKGMAEFEKSNLTN